MQNLLANSIVLYAPTILAIALTLIIYLLYYCMTVHTCCKMVLGKSRKGYRNHVKILVVCTQINDII